ncbi:hypothetical protein ACI6QG_08730 [Roseococcus sp. DSY-14]|uniref:hypothetical protein n=1 Tax=Roseococcus sp. DSY-14 TaxID=3369650 RepID=UPI00387B278F
MAMLHLLPVLPPAVALAWCAALIGAWLHTCAPALPPQLEAAVLAATGHGA